VWRLFIIGSTRKSSLDFLRFYSCPAPAQTAHYSHPSPQLPHAPAGMACVSYVAVTAPSYRAPCVMLRSPPHRSISLSNLIGASGVHACCACVFGSGGFGCSDTVALPCDFISCTAVPSAACSLIPWLL
jgi:hypothetical protein